MKIQVKKHFGSILVANIVLISAFMLSGCDEESDKPNRPKVITTEVSDITHNSVATGGIVTNIGNATLVESGIYWNMEGDPGILDNIVKSENDKENFVITINGLHPKTEYFVRAYAKFEGYSVVGKTLSFITSELNFEEDALNPNISYGEFTDSRDNNTYKTVEIGSQTWMAENLAYLPEVSPSTEESDDYPYYYVYGYEGTNVEDAKNTDNYNTYGVLYNWPAATEACPSGWHLPESGEWGILITYLIENGYNYDGSNRNDNRISKSLSSGFGWNNTSIVGTPGNTNYPEYVNKSGFSALPGGARSSSWTESSKRFSKIGEKGSWWGLSNYGYNNLFQINHNNSGVDFDVNDDFFVESHAHSVRCVKDCKDDNGFMIIKDKAYPLNACTHIWEGEPESGASEHYHSIVLATDINWFVHHSDDGGRSLQPTGVGSYFYFPDIKNNNQDITEGHYTLSHFYYALNVEYDFWDGIDWDNPSQEIIDKYEANEAKIVEIEGSIYMDIEKTIDGYSIKVHSSWINEVSAKFNGSLETVDFRH